MKEKVYNEIIIGQIYEDKSGNKYLVKKEDFSLNRKAYLIEYIETKTKKVYSETEFKNKLIRGNRNISYEQAQKEKKEIKKKCFIELSEELKLSKELIDICLKIFK